MRGLFLRIYLALAAILLAGVLGLALWDAARRAGPSPWLQNAASAPVVVEEIFAREADEARASAAAADALDADVSVVPPSEVPPPVRARLARGLPAMPFPGGPLDIWIPLHDGRVVRVRPTFPAVPPLPLALGLVLVAAAAAVWLQLRPLDRELARLADTASRFGAGDLAARAALGAGSPVAELGGRFDAMAARIAGQVDARQQLLLAVSHELRTPLQRLRFGVELLASAPRAEAEARAEALQGDLDALDALVGELLAWGKLEAQPTVSREPFALAPVLAALAADAGRARPNLDLAVTCAPDLTWRADRGLLTRAVSNLVGNAARHARTQVRITAAPGSVCVEDDGPGIPEADRARVLEPFVRLDAARDRDAGGVGLGLALVDRIARAHGGALAIETSALGGARVVLTVADAG